MKLLSRSRHNNPSSGEVDAYRRLAAISPDLGRGAYILPDFTREELYGNYRCYYLIPRLGGQPSIEALGTSFSIFYERCSEENNSIMLRVFAITLGHPEKLTKDFEIEDGDPDWRPYKYAAIITPKKEKDAVNYEYFIDQALSQVMLFPPNTGLLFSCSMDPKLRNYLARKTLGIKKAEPLASTKPVENKIDGGPVLISIAVFGEDKKTVKECCEIIRKAIPAPTGMSIRRIRRGEDFYKMLLPPKMPRLNRKVLNASYRTIQRLSLLPAAGMRGIEYTRFAKMPPAEEVNRGPIVLGRVENRTFSLSPEDLFRHAYIIGGTGSGKTNLLKLLIRNLHDLGYPVFVIDPHGELSAEMACIIGDSIYLHPLDSPFGFNPLELPVMKDREQHVLISVDELMNLFTNVFHLPETAMNVRYILQTVTRQIYKRGGIPTLAGLYKIVHAIYDGQDIGISDMQFREEERALRNMPDQSFISTLSRLQTFATDNIMRKLTSTTTIKIEEFMEEKKTVFFALPVPKIGLIASTLLASTLLLKIYYTRLTRYEEKKNEHVFVIVDEFQILQNLPILATILSEARKFGLHLILAHQYLEQLTPDVRQAAIANAGLKFIFSTSGDDVKHLAAVDPEFDRELKTLLSSLPVGHCIVKLASRKGDEILPPLVLEVDRFNGTPVRTIEQARTDAFAPPDVPFNFELINPVFKFIDPPFAMSQRIIHALMSFGGSATVNDIAGATNYKPDSVSKVVSQMASKGWVEKEIVKNRTLIKITSGFFEQFYYVSPSEKGKKLIDAALMHYLSKGYYVTPTKNVDIPRPDLICIPYEGFYLDYSNAVEVEIEATSAIVKNSLISTLTKKTPFKERHVWCSVEDFPTVLEFARRYANKKTVIIAPEKGGSLRMEVVDVGEVNDVFRRKNEIKIPDAGVEETYLNELEHEEEEVEQKTHPVRQVKNIPAAIRVRVRMALGNELLDRVQSEGLMDELLSIAVERNLPADEIIRTARELVEKKEREKERMIAGPSMQTVVQQAGQEDIIESLAKLNPNLSREDVEEIYEMFTESIQKLLLLGLSADDTKAVALELCSAFNRALEDISGPENGHDLPAEPVDAQTESMPAHTLPAHTPESTAYSPPVQDSPVLDSTEKATMVHSTAEPLSFKEKGGKERGKDFMKRILGMPGNVIELEGRRVRLLSGSQTLLKKLLESRVEYRLWSKHKGKNYEKISEAPPGNYILEIGEASFEVHIE